MSNLHSLKAFVSIKVTEDGIFILFKEEHPVKTSLSINVIEGVNVKSDKEEQLRKASLPIDDTDEGIDNLIKEEHPLKA